MKHVIIGTAGHVDHGKTTLIQALTGTNPDRLKEEQERGMTIDIGFAALRLPDGNLVGIVDVPGHERFLKNMLAGASGVDVVLLVVAADESVMPQTVEHLDILRILDVHNGVVALTKMDMVDAEWTDAVEEDVRSRLAGTFLSDAPILRVSARTGRGIEPLKRALLSAASRADARSAALPFRLPVDRVFTRPGFGTVVTGTLVAGAIRTGDAVEVLPSRLQSRVRGLQVHGQKVQEATAGSRVAVNLASVETEELQRGAQLAPPGTLAPVRVMDVTVMLLETMPKPLADRTRLRLHVGTAEVLVRLRLLDGNAELAPGARAYAQLRAEREFVAARGDRFVLRSYSPMHTIGGGVVLDTEPRRHRKGDPAVLAALQARERGTPEDVVAALLQTSPMGLQRKDIPVRASVTAADADRAVASLAAASRLSVLGGDRVIDASLLRVLLDRAAQALRGYHTQFPLRPGMPREELRAALARDVDPRAFAALLARWQQDGAMAQEGATVRLADFEVQLNERQATLLDRIETFYVRCGIATPTIEEVCAEVKAPPDAVNALLKVGVERGRFAHVQGGAYYAERTLDELRELIRKQVADHGTITVGALRDLTQSNRKFALALLEYLDTVRFTRRVGDERVLSEHS